MKRSLLVAIVLIFAGPTMLFANDIPTKDIKIKKTGKKATAVTFSHSEHAKTGDKFKDCTGCHNAVKSQKTAHKYCTDCHKSMNKGPKATVCKECHIPVK